MSRLMVPMLLGTAFTALLLLGLPRAARGESASAAFGQEVSQAVSPVEFTAPQSPVPDPRWLDLIRDRGLKAGLAQGPPSLNVNLMNDQLAGFVPSPAPVHFTVTRGVTQVATANITPLPLNGTFFYQTYLVWDSDLCDFNDCATNLVPADVIWLEQAGTSISLTVPVLEAWGESVAGTVFGQAPANDFVEIFLYEHADPEVVLTQTVQVDAAGVYAASWAPTYLVRPRDSGYVLHAPASNKSVFTSFLAPFLRVESSGTFLLGTAAPQNTVQLTLTDPGGSPLLTFEVYPYYDGSFETDLDFYLQNGEPVSFTFEPGYQVIGRAAGQTFSMTVAAVTAQSDLALGQVSGQAPAGSTVEVLRFPGPLTSAYAAIWDGEPVGQMTTTVDGSGQYSAAVPLVRGNIGTVLHASPAGQESYAVYITPYLWMRLGPKLAYLPYVELLQGQVEQPVDAVAIEVQGPSGYLKDFFSSPVNSAGYFGHGSSDNELRLDTGDHLTVSVGSTTLMDFDIPAFTVEADAGADLVSGLAPPGSRLTISVMDNFYPYLPPFPGGGPGGLANLTGGGGYSIETLVVTATLAGTYAGDFSPLGGFSDLSAGFITLKTPAGFDLYRHFRVVPACPPLLFEVQVGANRVEVIGSEACPEGIVRLRNAAGQLKAETPFYANEYAGRVELFDDQYRPVGILPGDRLEVASAAGSQQWTVPDLTVAIDPASHSVQGLAPANAGLHLRVQRYEPYLTEWLTGSVSAQGTYSVSLGALSLLGPGDRVSVIWEEGPPFFFARASLPIVELTLYNSGLFGILQPIEAYSIAVQTPRQLNPAADGYAFYDGEFSAYLISQGAGMPYPVPAEIWPSDTVVITTSNEIINVLAPALTAVIDPDTATVSGQAPPHARLEVSLSELLYASYTQVVTATATGDYSASFPELAPLARGAGRLTYANAAGHRIHLAYAMPRWEVTLGESCVEGISPSPGAPITITLDSAAFPYSETVLTSSSPSQGFFGYCFGQPIFAGDLLTIEEVASTRSFTVPAVSARYDPVDRILTGLAGPGWPILVRVFPVTGFADRHTVAGSQGAYGLDLSDLELDPNDRGWIEATDPDGNLIRIEFLQGRHLMLPIVRLP